MNMGFYRSFTKNRIHNRILNLTTNEFQLFKKFKKIQTSVRVGQIPDTRWSNLYFKNVFYFLLSLPCNASQKIIMATLKFTNVPIILCWSFCSTWICSTGNCSGKFRIQQENTGTTPNRKTNSVTTLFTIILNHNSISAQCSPRSNFIVLSVLRAECTMGTRE